MTSSETTPPRYRRTCSLRQRLRRIIISADVGRRSCRRIVSISPRGAFGRSVLTVLLPLFYTEVTDLVVHSGNTWMRTRADNELSQIHSDTGTSSEGRSIGGNRHQANKM